MRYRVMMSIEIEARDDRQAVEQTLKLKKMLEGPLVRMGVKTEGIQLSGDGSPVVHQPQRVART